MNELLHSLHGAFLETKTKRRWSSEGVRGHGWDGAGGGGGSRDRDRHREKEREGGRVCV